MLNFLKKMADRTFTENGAVTPRNTGSDCLDLFATIGALRTQSEAEIENRFLRAYAENPDLAMAQAEALDQMRSINGKKGAERLSAVLAEAGHLAGGDLSEDQLIEYTMELNKMAMQAQQRLREIHTNKRYQATVDAKAEETREKVASLNESIQALSEES